MQVVMSDSEVMKRYRKKHGLTQEQAAKKLGLTRSMIAMIENGQRYLPANIVTKIQG
ncbi:helix-turn-helix domain-containing protein [Sporolituus thermophilus]|uniref:helix-turn-helix domain-containing protein n=1 Tax=Sporolituus thermophilus TaxID=608505 RepID=UPI000B824E38